MIDFLERFFSQGFSRIYAQTAMFAVNENKTTIKLKTM